MTTLALTPERGLAFQTRLAANETSKGLRLMWRRRGMVAVGLLMNGLTYLGISLFIGGGRVVEELMVATLPALLAVVVAGTAAIQGTGGIAEEVNGGTLEQAQLSPAPPWVQALGRVAALAVEGLTGAALLGAAFIAGFGLHYDPHPSVLLPALLTVVDALGYGLLLAAMTVRVASIGAITHVFNMVIMFFGGLVVPIAAFPAALEAFARFVPTALGVQTVNTALAGDTTAALPWLTVHATVLFTAGLALYTRNIRRARREGGLSAR